jgi:prepilin-type processing-associated H-X9-DG protein
MINRDKASQVYDINHARPSSNHVDGVNVAYCDGSVRFLIDQNKYAQVYCKLMTPDGLKAADPVSKTPVQVKPYREPLDEAMVIQQ